MLLAPFVGSFLGTLVRRLPDGRPVVMGRSACESCGRALPPWEMIPVVSYFALRGRCRGCGSAIAAGHLGIELAAFGVVLWAAAPAPALGTLYADCIFGWALLALAWIDWQRLLLPDLLTLPLLLAGLGATAWLDPAATTGHAAAAMLGYGLFRALAAGYRRLRGRDGLGGGDAKLLAAIAAWTGFAGLPWVLLIAAAAGLVIALPRVARDGTAALVPFGPCLALGGWIVRLYHLPA